MSSNFYIPQGGNYIAGGTDTVNYSSNIGNDALAIADILKSSSAKFANLALDSEKKKAEQERIQAQEEFLKAKREGTLDLLRKATLSGELPEGLSPAYNDFRKVLLAKDAVSNVYQTELNSNINVLVDPDVEPQVKQKILQDAYNKSGIDSFQLDPVGKDIIMKQLSQVQGKLDSVMQQRSAEVNIQKMQNAMDKDAINAISAYDGDDSFFVSNMLASVKIARNASVKEPVKEVMGRYMQQINNVAAKDPEKALKMVEAMETAELDDGTPILGNIELISQHVKLRESIENDIERQDARAERLLLKQKNETLRALTSKISADMHGEPELIKAIFDDFINKNSELPVDQQVPFQIVEAVRKERDALVNGAEAVRSEDIVEVAKRQREVDTLKQIYGRQIADAVSSDEINSIINDVQSRDYLTAFDRAEIVKQAQQMRNNFEFAKSEFSSIATIEGIGYTGEDIKGLAKTTKVSEELVSALIEEGIVDAEGLYKETFDNELKRLADAQGLTIEQAKMWNKSGYVKDDVTKEMTADPYGSMNLVEQAKMVARHAVKQHLTTEAVRSANAIRKQKENRYSMAKGNLRSVDVDSFNAYRNGDEAVTSRALTARGALTDVRIQLSTIVSEIRDAEASDLLGSKASLVKSDILKQQYKDLQDTLGYSIRELLAEKTFAGMPIEVTRETLNPITTRLVWNRKELDVIRNMDEAAIQPLMSKLGVTRDEFVELQTRLL